MQTAIFTNFTSEPFIGYWDGKAKTFAPGARKLLPAYLAAHYATHLANRELIKKGDHTSTSPKNPEQVPHFMEMYNQAYEAQDDGDDEDIVEMPERTVTSTPREKTIVDNRPPQIIGSPDDSDETFEGLEDETPTE